MTATPSGHIAQLPSGSYRVEVNLGTDPITRRRIRLRDIVEGELWGGRKLQARRASTGQAGKGGER